MRCAEQSSRPRRVRERRPSTEANKTLWEGDRSMLLCAMQSSTNK